MSFKAITFDGMTRPASADGAVFYASMDGRSRILDGCSMSNSGNNITITAGYMAIGGRVIAVEGDTSYTVSPSLATGYGRLIINLDLNASPVFTFSEEYNASESGFTSLTTENINISGAIYQVEICRFTVSGSTAGTITKSLPTYRTSESATINLSFGGKTGTANVHKFGNMATIRFSFGDNSNNFSSVTGADTIGAVPEQFKPLLQTSTPILFRSGSTWSSATNSATCLISVNTAGNIIVNCKPSDATSAKFIVGSLTWICAPYIYEV